MEHRNTRPMANRRTVNDPCLIDANRCSRALGITKGCLYRMAREGMIPSYRVGMQKRCVRFDLEEVRQALRDDNVEEDE